MHRALFIAITVNADRGSDHRNFPWSDLQLPQTPEEIYPWCRWGGFGLPSDLPFKGFQIWASDKPPLHQGAAWGCRDQGSAPIEEIRIQSVGRGREFAEHRVAVRSAGWKQLMLPLQSASSPKTRCLRQCSLLEVKGERYWRWWCLQGWRSFSNVTDWNPTALLHEQELPMPQRPRQRLA